MNKNIAFFSLVLLAILVARCDGSTFEPIESSSSSLSNSPSDETLPKWPDGEKSNDSTSPSDDCISYSFLNHNPDCLPSLPLVEIQKESLDYEYRDPLEDPSFPSRFDPSIYSAPSRLLTLSNIDPRLWLSPYFQLGEFMSTEKGAFAVFSALAVKQLQLIREAMGHPLMVTSGYRSPGYNSAIPGAATWSRHTFGDAVDLIPKKISLNELAELCLDYGASYYQIYEKHVHCDWRSFEKDKQFFGEQARGRTMSKITRSLEQESSITSTTQADYIEFKAHHPLS